MMMASSVWGRVLDSPERDDFVQFYGSDGELLVRNVSKYLDSRDLEDGLRQAITEVLGTRAAAA